MPDTKIKVKFDNPNVKGLVVWVVRRRKPHNKPVRRKAVRVAFADKATAGFFEVSFDRVTPNNAAEKILAHIVGVGANGELLTVITRRVYP